MIRTTGYTGWVINRPLLYGVDENDVASRLGNAYGEVTSSQNGSKTSNSVTYR